MYGRFGRVRRLQVVCDYVGSYSNRVVKHVFSSCFYPPISNPEVTGVPKCYSMYVAGIVLFLLESARYAGIYI